MLNKLVVMSVLVMGFASAGQVYAQDREVTQVKVSTYGVNFQDEHEVKTFYKRLKRAAVEACDSGFKYDLSAKAEDQACAAQALEVAVTQINQPALSLAHNGQASTRLMAATGGVNSHGAR